MQKKKAKRVIKKKSLAKKSKSLPVGNILAKKSKSEAGNTLGFYISERTAEYGKKKPFKVSYEDSKNSIKLLKGDCVEILKQATQNSVDMIFADPPYFLSNGGISCHAGKMVSVNKGKWDKSKGVEENHQFNLDWLEQCQNVLKPDGTIWVSGTSHIIHSIGYAMQKLGFKILNDIIWYKRNAPPNLSCRYFTHSTETVLWASKNLKSKHYFDYKLMKHTNGDKQMRNVWEFTSPSKAEKVFGKHPTQKPLSLLERIILSSTKEGDLVLDPFCGSSTTGVSALNLNRKYVGIEIEDEYLKLSKLRLKEASKNILLFSHNPVRIGATN